MYHAELDLLKSTRSETLALLNSVSDPQLRFTPAGGLRPFEVPFLALRALSPAKPRWSIGEVLDHVLRFESVFRSDIEAIVARARAGQDPTLQLGFKDINVSFGFIPRVMLPVIERPVSAFSDAMPNGLVEFLAGNRLLPAQSPDITAPRKGRPGVELDGDLRHSLQATEALFAANADLDFRHMYRQHPTTGRQTVPEALRLIALHEQRHHAQIREIMSDRAFPAR